MEKEIALGLIDETKAKLERYLPDDRGYLQNIINCRGKTLHIAKNMFGENSNHNKIISQSDQLSNPA